MNDHEYRCACPPTGPSPVPRWRVCIGCGEVRAYFGFRPINPHRGVYASKCLLCEDAGRLALKRRLV
jgi:hypothetical protein